MIKFGTGGWRAIIGDDFTKENISLVAQAISEILIQDKKNDKPVMIGFDRRFLSELGTKWLCEVFAANGIKVWPSCCKVLSILIPAISRTDQKTWSTNGFIFMANHIRHLVRISRSIRIIIPHH